MSLEDDFPFPGVKTLRFHVNLLRSDIFVVCVDLAPLFPILEIWCCSVGFCRYKGADSHRKVSGLNRPVCTPKMWKGFHVSKTSQYNDKKHDNC